MGGKFGDLAEYFDPGLTLTVNGGEYVLPLPSAELGLWCRRVTALRDDLNAAATDDEIHAAVGRVTSLPPLPGDMTFPERLLGPAYQQMVADKVPDPYIQFCSQVAYIWIVGGEDLAQRYWESGGRPELTARANRAERRATDRKTSTAAASTTNPQGSTSGTSSRKRSRRNGRGGASRGQKS